MNQPMRSMLAMLAGAVLTAMVSGCHSQQKAGHGEVSGQILPGSVSDAMLPYDSLKSNAPLAPRRSKGGSGDAGDDAADSAASTVSGDAAAPDTPASPSPVVPGPGN